MRKIRISLLVTAFAVATFYLTPVRHVLASGVQALASVIAGGTGRTTLGANGVLIGEGTSPVNVSGAGTVGQVFTSNGAGMDPTFQVAAGGGGGSSAGAVSYSASGLTITANTYFFPPGGGLASSTTEANVDVGAPAGTFQNFNVAISQAVGMGNSAVFTWRKNGADQAVTCTISGAAAASCNDTTHSFTTAAGDLVDVKLVTTGTIVVTPNIVMLTAFGASLTQPGMSLISDQLLGSPAATVTFSSIAGSYKHLRLLMQAACSSATTNQGVGVTINADSGNNYSRQFNLSSNAMASQGQNNSTAPATAAPLVVPCASAIANTSGSAEMTILNYAATVFLKQAWINENYYSSNVVVSQTILNLSWTWASTAAITSIALAPADASNFVTGSRFTLYGLN